MILFFARMVVHRGVGRKTRRAHRVANRADFSAPVLSRSVDVALPELLVWLNIVNTEFANETI
jgi:hypothetical protein